jgi:hypothetical protein
MTRMTCIWHEYEYSSMIIYFSFLLRMRIFSDKSRRKTETPTLCPVTFSENAAVYETDWKNTVDLEKWKMTIWWKCISYL